MSPTEFGKFSAIISAYIFSALIPSPLGEFWDCSHVSDTVVQVTEALFIFFSKLSVLQIP